MTMSTPSLLLDRLHRAGLSDAVSVTPVEGGVAALAGLATRRTGPPVFVKAFRETPADGLFAAEAEGLRALRDMGGAATPEVVHAGGDVLVLSALEARPAREDFWERLAHTLARLHTTTVHDRFGWPRDNWLGRCRQDNAWDADGPAFFARSRLLRWLPEPRVRAALDARDRRALERLCERLPELLPSRPPCLTHGDLWSHNILATPDGQPALIDPAVSFMWPEVDLAHLWSSPHPPEAKRFFAQYAELTGLDDAWPARMPVIQLRQHLAVIAQHEHDWGAAEQVRATLKPFRS